MEEKDKAVGLAKYSVTTMEDNLPADMNEVAEKANCREEEGRYLIFPILLALCMQGNFFKKNFFKNLRKIFVSNQFFIPIYNLNVK